MNDEIFIVARAVPNSCDEDSTGGRRMIDVTTVTHNASQDALTDADYLGIIDSLRGPLFGYSWQRIADVTGYNSKAWWALVAKGERQLDDEARNALRRVTDGELPEQPPSVTDVTQRMVHPDAEMLLVGTLEPGERVRRVLMLAQSDVVLHVNGDVVAKPLQAATNAVDTEMGIDTHTDNVTHVTPARTAQGAKREPVYRPVLSLELKQRVTDSGRSVEELIEMALATMEEKL